MMADEGEKNSNHRRKSILKIENGPKRKWSHKSTRFDENNIKKTYHPAEKDYGLMQIDEPPTPHPDVSKQDTVLKADELRKKLELLNEREVESNQNSDIPNGIQIKHDEFIKKRTQYHTKEYDRDRISSLQSEINSDEEICSNHKEDV